MKLACSLPEIQAYEMSM